MHTNYVAVLSDNLRIISKYLDSYVFDADPFVSAIHLLNSNQKTYNLK